MGDEEEEEEAQATERYSINNKGVLKCLLETLNIQLFLTLTTIHVKASLEINIFSEPRSSVRAPSDPGSARLNFQTFYTWSLFFGLRPKIKEISGQPLANRKQFWDSTTIFLKIQNFDLIAKDSGLSEIPKW